MVTQATRMEFSAAVATRSEMPGSMLTLVRMEIGGIRFVTLLDHVAAVIEPTAMEELDHPEDSVWIGRIASAYGSIAIASGAELLQIGDRTIKPGRLAILRGVQPVGIAVDRVLGSRTIRVDDILKLPDTVAALKDVPVSGAIWSEDDEIELVIDTRVLLADLASDVTAGQEFRQRVNLYRQNIISRYGKVDYRRALEVHIEGSDIRWALPMATVRLVTDAPTPHPLPRMPRQIAGLLSWQRNPIPVIDPGYGLGIDQPVSLPAKAIVIGEPASGGASSDAADAAILVSSINGIHGNLQVGGTEAQSLSGDRLRIIRFMDLLS